MDSLKKLSIILRHKKPLLIGLLVGITFFIIYLISVGHLIKTPVSDFSLSIVEDLPEKLFKTRAPFIWEPIAVLNFFKVSLFISINLVLGIILSALVFFNIGIAVFSYSVRKICMINPGGAKSLVGILPAMFTGFACCVPTFIIALAPALASFTVFFIQIQPFIVPASIIIMSWGLYWSLSRITDEHLEMLSGAK